MPGKYTAHHPPLPDKPGDNWVSRAGGLPPEIDAVARALKAKGYTTSRAVATAVSQIKKVCATGRAFGGRTPVSAEARAKACKAAARWEAMKAEASVEGTDREAVELAYGDRQALDLASTVTSWRIKRGPRKGQTIQVRLGPGGKWKEIKGKPQAGQPGRPQSKVKPDPAKVKAALKQIGRQFAPERKVDPRATKDHAEAGLHRLGTSGNAFVDRDGKVWHRNREGTFSPGVAKSKKGRKRGLARVRSKAARVKPQEKVSAR